MYVLLIAKYPNVFCVCGGVSNVMWCCYVIGKTVHECQSHRLTIEAHAPHMVQPGFMKGRFRRQTASFCHNPGDEQRLSPQKINLKSKELSP